MKTPVLLLISIFINLSSVAQNNKKLQQLVEKYQLDTIGSIEIGWLTTWKENRFVFGNQEEQNALRNIASVSKTFTGLAILNLIQDKKISPDDKIRQYIPELSGQMGEVTVEQLAFHTNGIHDFFSLVDNPKGLTNDQVLQMLSTIDTCVFEPGTNWGYSNSGYILLAEIIERVTGTSYKNYLDREIFIPMNMKNVQLYPQGKSELLMGHDVQGKSVTIQAQTVGSGNLLAHANDLEQFGKALMNNNQMKAWIDLSESLSQPWIRDSNWKLGYGFWFSEDEYGPFIAGSGRSTGSIAYYRYYTEKKKFIWYMANQDPTINKAFRKELIHLFMAP